jgi:hypothetical protein
MFTRGYHTVKPAEKSKKINPNDFLSAAGNNLFSFINLYIIA